MQLPPIGIPLLFASIYPACLVWAADNDAHSMTIPNRTNIILALAFLPAALLVGLPLFDQGTSIFDLMHRSDIPGHLVMGMIGFILGVALFFFGFMGGGDAKLIAAVSLWFDFNGWVAMLIYTALAGGALTLGLVVMRKFFWGVASKLPPWVAQHFDPKGKIPYGLAICAGGLLAMPKGDILALLMHV